MTPSNSLISLIKVNKGKDYITLIFALSLCLTQCHCYKWGSEIHLFNDHFWRLDSVPANALGTGSNTVLFKSMDSRSDESVFESLLCQGLVYLSFLTYKMGKIRLLPSQVKTEQDNMCNVLSIACHILSPQ